MITELKTANLHLMKLGESFETKGLLRGVSNVPLVWTLVEIHKTYLEFKVTYYGIYINSMKVYPSENYRIVSK